MTHRTLIGASAVCLCLAVLGAGLVQAQQYVFRDIDVPGASSTYIAVNNNADEIVGCYGTTGFSSGEGVLLANAAFKIVKGPSGYPACIYGVSNDGKISGTYQDTGGKIHGFLLVGKTYTILNYPGAVETDATGVNKSGVVVGYYSLGAGYQGFTWQSGTFTTIDYPGASDTYAWAINDSGVLAGEYSLSGVHGFSLSGGTYTSIDYPGAAGSAAFGINNAAQIVGLYYDTTGTNNGFTDISGVFSTVDYPGAYASSLTGINDDGQVVGVWFGPTGSPNGYDEHGFLATPVPTGHAAERGAVFGRKGLLGPR